MSEHEHFADRLLAACRAKACPVCVGIDPVYDKLPAPLQRNSNRLAAISKFVGELLQAVAGHVPCVKLQSACFERYHWQGIELYHQLIEQARSLGLVVIGDAKRGDIGISAEHYAAGCLADSPQAAGPDALTINSYFGRDGIMPFVEVSQRTGKGLFALVRTSNPGGDAIQSLELAAGGTVAQAVGKLVAQLGSGSELVGQSGYSLLGAVVGATKAQDAAMLRQLMPQQIFLVPGFGAQGGKADDVKACFKADGTGAIVTASRSVIFAYLQDTEGPWQSAVERAAVQLKREVAAILA